MNKYESVIIVNPNLSENEQKEIQKKYEKIITENGILKKTDVLGIKKLAYQIRNNKEGYYLVFCFESQSSFISELERKYRIDDNVMKFITVKMEG